MLFKCFYDFLERFLERFILLNGDACSGFKSNSKGGGQRISALSKEVVLNQESLFPAALDGMGNSTE